MNHKLSLPSHGLRSAGIVNPPEQSRAGSPSSGWPRSSVLSLLLLALALVTPVASWGVSKASDGSYYSSWHKFKDDANTGVTFYVRAYEEAQCKKIESTSTYPPEFYMVMSNREVTPTKPYIEIEMPLIRLDNDCYTTINLLSKTSSGGTETIQSLCCYVQGNGKKVFEKWITKNTNYGVWRHVTTNTYTSGNLKDLYAAVLQFYPTKDYYAKGICCIEVIQKWDWNGDGGPGNMSNYKFTSIDNSYSHTIDNVHTYHLYPKFSDTTYEPTVERKAPQQVTFTVEPGKGQNNSRKYVYNIDWGSGWKDVEVTSGTSSYVLDGAYDDGLTYKWLAYSLQEMTFTTTDYSGNSTPNVTACVFAGGPTVNTGTDTNIGWTFKDVTVGASSDVKSISSIVFDKWAKKVTIEWTKNDGTQTNGHWGIYRTLNGTRKYLGWVEYSTLTYTDSDQNLEYDKSYTYEVSYLPGTGTDYTNAQLYYLNKTKDITLARSFNFGTMTLEEKEINSKTNIVFTWSHEAITDASSSKTYTLYVQRSTDGGKNWTNLGSPVSITSNATTGGSYNDADVNVRQPYQYRVKINVQGKDFYSSASEYSITEGSKLTGFQASRGNYNNVVKLSWTVNQVGTNPTYFTLQRRPLGSSGDAGWADIYTTSGTASNYSYDDNTAQPGSFNEYRLRIFDEYDGTMYEGTSMTTDGFSIATGVVSGRITYGSGTAVQGAKVTLSATNADGKSIQSNKAIYLSGEASSGLACQTTNEEIKKILGDGNAFTVQFWMRPQGMTDGGGHILTDVAKTFGLQVKKEDSSLGLVCMIENNQSFSMNLPLTSDVWQHVSVVYANGKLKAYSTIDGKSFKESDELSKSINQTNLGNATALGIGNWQNLGSNSRYQGYLDEFRIFSRALTLDEIKQNYNHTLNGSEEGLQVYYPFDEGMENQKVAYDFSKQNGVANAHHATALIGVLGQDEVVPSEDQLSLMTYTDKDGNYMLRGIPFSGEGTAYTITPTLGIHKFNPANESRFFNQNSLSYSGVNFEDVSSFPVSGTVYFDNTTIPVEDVYLYVDGMLAQRDGEAVKTNAQGEFKVDVPIGDHFIQVKKSGHTFVNGGRYPEDPDSVGTRVTFEGEIPPLMFLDNTRVTVAGRVAGGDIEYEKPLGLLQSVANIGKAKLTLTYANSDKCTINATRNSNGNWNESTTQRDFDASTPNVDSKAYVVGSTAQTGRNKITIETDPITGEWAAELLPLRYTVESVSIPSNVGITFTSLPTIDATNPLVQYTDSMRMTNGKLEEFNYCASAKLKYKTSPFISVTEHEDGMFGEKSIAVVSRTDDTDTTWVSTYGVNETTGKLEYNFGYPIYKELFDYTYNIKVYERYINKDGATEVEDLVPLADKEMTIINNYSTKAVITVNGDEYDVQQESFKLDSLGQATYRFTAGLPNVQPPYTRGITIGYDDNGTMVQWSQNNTFKAIVLGALPTGNNFVTAGPDKVITVLRDPPGSGSSATYTKGHSFIETDSWSGGLSSTTDIVTTSLLGNESFVGTGIGAFVITETKETADLDVGISATFRAWKDNCTVVTHTTTHDISTSDAPDYVGSNGDVFIGVSRNRIFGECINVCLDKTDNGNYIVTDRRVLGMNEEYGTSFMYTAQAIENRLIPDFEKLRDSLLVYNADPATVTNGTKNILYVTSLKPGDWGYGTSNSDKTVWGDRAVTADQAVNGRVAGPSYHLILPANLADSTFTDEVQYFNKQISVWKEQLYKNEEAKVKAISQRSKYLKDNYSFDGGTTFSETVEYSKSEGDGWSGTEEVSIFGGITTGVNIGGIGVKVSLKETITPSFTESEYEETVNSHSYNFNLVEDGTDYLSVDVFQAPDGYGPIFYTRAGATCCPYEDEVKTKYYEPGKVISEKTVQVEKPEIEALTSLISGIPAGGQGNFQVYIRNNSDIKDNLWYNLNIADASNPDGLIVEMDGVNINRGRSILVPAGETMTKTFTVRQSNPDVMEYRNIQLRISSQCQPDNTGLYPEIADTTTFSVFFQPACSDVHLASTHTLVNTETATPVTLSISGYNHSMKSLEGIRLEYKGQNDANFTTLQEYNKIDSIVAKDKNLLLLPALEGTNKLNYVVDLRDSNFSDQTYVFRAVTKCMQGGVEVNNESEEIEIVRDMTRPMLIAQPTPSSGILGTGDNLTITFNEDIKSGSLSKPNNFEVLGVLNETKVAHEVALSLTGENAAKTDATMELNGKSFATSMWVNYSTDGTLLQHGTADNNFTVAIENEKLAVSVNDNKVASTVSMPKDKWMYLNVSYNAEDSTVSAGYAKDAETVSLISNAKIGAYEGNGPVALGGNNLTAKVQELAIWNSNRSMAEAQADMYTSKSQFTKGLMGYWQLNEGRGEVATDRARSRNLTLPSQNAWWIAGDNYALVLDGQKAAAANIGALNTTDNDDYLVEAWFKADETQNGVASVLSTLAMDLRLNTQGKMEMVLDGSPLEVMNTDLRDGQWHHVAVNALKSTNGSGIVYIDGKQCLQVSSLDMPVLFGDKLMLGSHRISVDGQGLYAYDQMLKGAIDEVRIWKSRRTDDVIKDNMYNRVKGNEAGLVAYYPLERLGLDTYNQVVTTVNMEDATEKQAGELSFFTAGAAVTTGTTTKDNTAALKTAPNQSNVQFSFVASERQITVNLTEQPYKMEGCNIYITAKNVKDVHGNSALPITWGVYVQQDNLKWQENELAVTKAGTEATTFTAIIENHGSESEAWSLSGMPTWLSANTEAGTLTPLASQKLTFTVAGSLPIGTYETTVYLTGSQNINTPLNITVESEGDAPNWVAIPGESTMTVVGVLKIDGVQSSDPKDMVAAFRGTECVGVTSPKYFSHKGSYMVMLNIYGDEDADLVYKAYDASTGTIYPSVEVSNASANKFKVDKAVGSINQPVTFSPLNEIEQDLSMNRIGWKWFSLYATPKNADASVVFKDATSAINTVTDGEESVINWVGDLTLDNPATMYKLSATEPYVESFIGEPTVPTAIDITLKGNGWTWIGYPCQATNSLEAAFASAEPEEGDMVKNQNSFSYYTGEGWIGTLTAMVPGDGYLYNSVASANKTFNYPTPAVIGKKNAPRRAAANVQSSMFNGQWKDNMTMIAVVMDGNEVVENAQVSVYANGELCAFSGEAVRDSKHFLTIGGENADVLTFVVSTPEGDYFLSQTDVFQVNAMRGSLAKPVVLQLGEATGIEMVHGSQSAVHGDMYDLQGRKVENIHKKGVYINQHQKVVVK